MYMFNAVDIGTGKLKLEYTLITYKNVVINKPYVLCGFFQDQENFIMKK